jgi:hypothetical protein
MIRQQTPRAPRFGTVPACNPCSRRPLARIRPMAREPAAAPWMTRATLQRCSAPSLLGNVLLAGKPRIEPKLHQHRPVRRRHAARATLLVLQGYQRERLPAHGRMRNTTGGAVSDSLTDHRQSAVKHSATNGPVNHKTVRAPTTWLATAIRIRSRRAS